jgi:hypothetical protein
VPLNDNQVILPSYKDSLIYKPYCLVFIEMHLSRSINIKHIVNYWEMIFIQLKFDNFWTTISYTFIIFLLFLFFFYFIVFVIKEKKLSQKVVNFKCSNNIALNYLLICRLADLYCIVVHFCGQRFTFFNSMLQTTRHKKKIKWYQNLMLLNMSFYLVLLLFWHFLDSGCFICNSFTGIWKYYYSIYTS